MNNQLARILLERSYHVRQPSEEPFVLASGEQSWHYFECQRTTSFAEALPLIGEEFYSRLPDSVVCVGGLTRGADPIADAIACYSAQGGRRLVNTFSVRKAPKDHGTKQWIEGSAEPGDTVAVVDDVVTSGGSVIKAIERCRAEGLRVAKVIVLVDREERSGLANIRESAGPGVPVEAIFRFAELQESERQMDRQSTPRVHRDLARAV